MKVSPADLMELQAGRWPEWLLRKWLGFCRWLVVFGCGVSLCLYPLTFGGLIYFLTMALLAVFVIRLHPVREWQQRWTWLQSKFDDLF